MSKGVRELNRKGKEEAEARLVGAEVRVEVAGPLAAGDRMELESEGHTNGAPPSCGGNEKGKTKRSLGWAPAHHPHQWIVCPWR